MPLSKPTVAASITPMTVPVPQRDDRTNFAARGDVFLSEMPPTVTGINTSVAYIDSAVQYVEQEATAAEVSNAASGVSAAAAAASAASATGAANVNGTSATTRTPSLASLTWVYVEASRVPAVGMRLRAASRANPTTNYGAGVVTAWDSGTGTVTISVDVIGTIPLSASDWNIILEGEQGEDGLTETTILDKGTVTSGTCTMDIGVSDRKQKVTAGGNFTLAFTGWPPAGRLGELWVVGYNFGAYTVGLPTGTWTRADGVEVATATLAGITFPASGRVNLYVTTDDGGTSIEYSVRRG